jgi:uncharacterized repeat protein (TIGR01451 family)
MKLLLKTALLFIVALFVFGTSHVFAQNLQIDITIPKAGESRFSVCAGERIVKIRIENVTPTRDTLPTGTPLTNIKATIDLSVLSAMGLKFTGTINSLSGGTVTVASAAPNKPVFNIPDLLKRGDVVEFEIGIQADCDALSLALGTAFPNFDVKLNYTGGTTTQKANTGSFEVVKPALSIPKIIGNNIPGVVKAGFTQNIFDGIKGKSDTITVNVVNAGNGPLSKMVYWVKDHPLLTLQKVLVCNPVTKATVELVRIPSIPAHGDTIFYAIPPTAIAFATSGIGSPTNNASIFQFNEQLSVKEIWKTDDCAKTFPDIVRGVRYGCAGGLTDKCEEAIGTSGLRFGFVRPILTPFNAWGKLTDAEWKEGLPACYATQNPKQRIYIVNSGTGNAVNVKFNLAAYRSELDRAIDTSKVFVSIGKYGTKKHPSAVKTYMTGLNGNCSGSGQRIYSADYNLGMSCVVKPGDTLWVEFQMDYGCGCSKDGGLCTMENWYFGVFAWGDRNWSAPSTYEDACGLQKYDISQVNTTDAYGRLTSTVEGPATILGGQTNTTVYTVSDAQNTWLTSWKFAFPNGIYRTRYKLAKGLDWCGTNGDLSTNQLQWVDKNGIVWKPGRVQYVDNNKAGDDYLEVDYKFADFPAGFVFSPGMQIKLNYKGDCVEAVDPCVRNANTFVQQTTYFSPDANCTDCGLGQLVSCTNTLPIVVKCPSCGPCEGLSPLSMSLERTSFEKPDNNNDNRPDATGAIDKTKIRLDRFISGDTLTARYKGVFSSNTGASWPNAFSAMNLPAGYPANILPIGGKVTIRPITGQVYTATILQQFPDGQTVVTDLSPAKLRSLGNTGIPASYTGYAPGDTVCVDVKFTVVDPCFNVYTDYDVLKELLITDNSFASTSSTWTDAKNNRFACDDIRARAYLVKMKAYLNSSNGSYAGGCDLIYTGYDWTGFFIGSHTLDYFPYEYRAPKANQLVAKYYKDPTLTYNKFRWHFYAKDFIGRPFPVGSVPVNSGNYYALGGSAASGDYWGELPMNSPYLTIIGDTLCFAVDKFRRDNFPNFTADEGYRFTGYPWVQGTCKTPKTNGQTLRWKPFYTFAMNEGVFGYNNFSQGRYAICPGKTAPVWDLVYGYAGGPNLILQTPIKEQQAIGDETCFEVQLTNLTDFKANLVWMTVNSPSGAVVIKSIKEKVGTTSTVINPTLGMYQLGAMAGGATTGRVLEICVSSNNCSRDSIVINAGWECNNYPRTFEEATCGQTQALYIKPIDYELGMVIVDPQAPVVTDLCGEKEYIVQLSSTKLGSLSNINLEFEMPSGQEYIPGSFVYAYPLNSGDPAAANFKQTADPTLKYGTTYTINVSQQDPILSTTGLPGTYQVGKNFMFVKFKTRTTCNYMSGASVNFLSYAYTACGQLANYRSSPAAAVKIKGIPEVYKTDIQLNAATLNPCKGEKTTTNVTFGILPNSVPTSGSDSLRVILPPGMDYVSGSYSAGPNAAPTTPKVVNENGQKIIYFDLKDGLSAGTTVGFSFDVVSKDAGQECRIYPIIAQTFSTKPATCVTNGQICNVKALSDETRQNITFVKPNLTVTNFSASSLALAPNQEELTYNITLQNSGASVAAGVPTNIEIWSDNGDGDLGAGDQLLYTATTTESIPSGATITITGNAKVPSGNTCLLLAVINPGTTCTCSLSKSFQAKPKLVMPFTKDVKACSNTLLTNVGPPALNGITYEWFGLNGAPIGALSSSTTSPTNFKLRNTTPNNLKLQYAVRIIRGGGKCYSFDTLTVTLYPEKADSSAFSVCQGSSFNLSGPTDGTNYQWTPTANLTNQTASATTVTGGIAAPTRYVLNYTGANGCPAQYIANVKVTECANTALGDTVWYDRNENGIQEAGEPGVAGVTVYLYNATNTTTPIAQTTTNAQGFYIFDKIPFGNYKVGFKLPNGTTFTKTNIGNDAKDSDPDPTTGITAAVFVPNGVRDMTVDAGIVFKDWGDAPNSYKTDAASTGPSHLWQSGLRLGALWDANVQGALATTGQPARGDDNNGIDDEDGVASFPALNTMMSGQTYTLQVNVVDSLNLGPKLVAWIDFNGNGIFESSEGVQVNVPAGTNGPVPVSFTVPANIKAGITYSRFRLSTDATLSTAIPSGQATDGEVEDYELTINNLFDWGDAPDSYTTDAAGVRGPSHIIVNNLKLGANIDAENDGQPVAAGADALGDNNNGSPNDEDGVAAFPTVYNSYSSYTVPVKVQNITGKDARLIAWIDWNGDGAFQASEGVEVPVPNGTDGTVNVTWTIPTGAAAGKTYARFRLTYDPVITKSTPGGAANSGEVEDYQFTILPCVKPNAGFGSIVCLPTTITDLVDAAADQEWYAVGTNPTSVSIDPITGSVSGMDVAGKYKFVLRYKPAGTTCTDTVTITVNPKPSAGPDKAICEPQTQIQLAGTPTGGVWTAMVSNPAGSIDRTTGAVTGMTALGTYYFIYSNLACNDSVKVMRYLKPKAGDDFTICNSQQKILLNGLPAGGKWTVLSQPAGANVQIDTDVANSLIKSGNYTFVYDIDGCTDTITVKSNPLPVYSLTGNDPTCNDQGLPNNNGKMSISTASIGNSYLFNTTGFSTLATTPTGVTNISALPVVLAQNILNSDPTKVYYVRVFNEFGCYKDSSVTLRQQLCNQRYGSIGNYVWRDTNNDGKQTTGEPPVANIKVYLLNASGQKIDSTVTDANGKYLFKNLVSGTYRVQFLVPISEDVTTPNVSGAFPTDTLDSDVGASGLSHPITIQVALADADTLRNNPHIDLGLKPQYGSIGNYVWQDNNNDGKQDDTEPPITGVKVYLLSVDGQKVDSTVTDATGYYVFDSLASGNYKVKFVAPAGTIVSPKKTDADAIDSDINNAGLTDLITLDVTKNKTDILRNNPNIDAGFVPVGSIGNYVWNDTNGDGKQDPTEPGVAGIKVYLLNSAGQIIDSTKTDANGKYLFDSLLVGQYKVKFVAPTGSEFTGQSQTGDNTNDSDANYSSGTTDPVSIDPTQPLGSPARDNRDVDAGLKMQYGSIGNYVWSDLNNDGIQDVSEPAIAGVTVYLYKVAADGALTKIDSDITDANGKYLFDSLLNNTYRLQFVPPVGFITAKKETTNDSTDSNIDTNGFTANVVIDVNRPPTEVLRNNLTIDAGFVPVGSIGNFVWADTDKDGLQDPTELGVKGVKVILYKKNAAGQFVKADSTFTDANGKYLFDSLLVGDYQVQFVAPAASEFTTKDIGSNNADALDSDANYATGQTATVSIDPSKALGSSARDNRDVDAGLWLRYGSIGDYVWRDDNVDGKQDGSEPAIADVKVYLLDNTGKKIDSTLTDANGKYLFDSLLSGTYRVQFVKPAGMKATLANVGLDSLDSDVTMAGLSHPITIDVSKNPSDTLRNNPQIDAGFVRVGSIGDFVWFDTNGDGKQDPTEKGIAGVKVYLLDNNGKIIDSTTTDADGKYLFSDLLPDTYQIQFKKPKGADFSPANVGDINKDSNANVLTGLTQKITIDVTKPIGDPARDNRSIDAGMKTPFGSIGNYVWRDDNNDGKQDATELPIKGATVYLLNENGLVLDSILTDANGKYLFDSLVSGKYRIKFGTPAGMILTTTKATGVSDTLNSDAGKNGISQVINIDVTLLASDTLRNNPHIDAGFVPVGSIGNFVWLDTNKDGVQDPTEKGVAGVKVYLYIQTASGLYQKIDSTTTDANGKYLFDSLQKNNYKVQFVAPSGSEFTKQNATVDALNSDADFTTGTTDVVNIDPLNNPIGSPARDNRDVDAGLLTQFGSIGNYVWSDLNNDGKQDSTEPPIKGVKVFLYKADATGNLVKIDSTLTDASGKYLFDSLLTGIYKVQFIAPNQTLPAKRYAANDSTDSNADVLGMTGLINIDVTKLDSDTLRNNPKIDAGFVPVGTIGNFVWRDNNGDGKQDPTEKGLAQVRVYLLDKNGIKIDSTITDSLGHYLFNNVLSGQYQVKVILPSGAQFTGSNATADSLDSDFDQNGLSHLITIDASKPLGDTLRNNPHVDAGILPQYGSIGNYVWRDDNRDGKQDGSEPPIAGVKVYLLNDSGKKIDSTLTNAQGKYLFDSLISGKYQVQFVPPAGTIVTKANAGLDTLDSDISTAGLIHYISIDVTKNQADTLRNNPTIDAGFVPLGSIGNFVWADDNKDGKQDPAEKGVEGVRVYLYQKNANDQFVIIDSTFTDAIGKYLFDSLVAGDYEVQFKPKTNTEFTIANAVADSLDSDANFLTGMTGTVTLDTKLPIGDPARDNRSVDAGLIIQYGLIGNYVWTDSNNDGKQDPTEAPIAGVKVVLWIVGSDGKLTKVTETLTDANGEYLFDSLLTGQYQVQFIAPVNMIASKTNTVADTLDSDAAANGFSHIVNIFTNKLPSDTLRNNPTVDAGFVPKGSIGNYVWNDTNKDGIQDPNEVGVNGVKVILYKKDVNGVFVKADSVYTDTNGKYLFDSLLTGDYQIQFVPPAGTEFTKTNAGNDPTVDSNADFTTGKSDVVSIDTSKPSGDPARDNRDTDAGLLIQFGSIGDYVWRDDNYDGIQDSTEPAIEGVKVYLLNASGVRIDSTTTNANGKYLFDSLASGQYRVQFVAPAGMMATKANIGKDSLDSDVSKAGLSHLITLDVNKLKADTLRNNPNIDAGFVRVGSVGDYVWLDTNADGIQDPAEPGVAGEKVYLLDKNGVIIDSTTTDANGHYLFENVLPGTYQIKFKTPAGLTFSPDNQGTDDNKDSDADEATGLTPQFTIDVTKPIGDPARDNRSIDAGVKTPFGSIGDYVWQDNNNDGKQDSTEPPIAGVKVYLYDNAGKILDSTTTNAQGKYLFDSLLSGQYKIRFKAPEGTIAAKANAANDTLDSDAGLTGFTHLITIDVTKLTKDTLRNNPQIDAGFVPVGSIGNYVWLDSNGDGKQDPTEKGVADVKVYLLDASGKKIDSTFTDSQGKYLFDSLLSGNYQVQFVLPLGAEFTKQNAGSDTLDSDVSKLGLSQVITIDATKPLSDTLRNNPNLDAGILSQFGSIGNYVWLDTNNDGKQDPTEAPIAGVKVYLLDATGKKIDSTTTNAQGKYLFDSLLSGQYKVQFVAPAGTIIAKANAANDTLDSDISKLGISQLITIDVTKAQTDTLRNNPNIDAGFVPVGSIGNYVWLDSNGDGKQDPTEKGVADVKVYLLDASGKKIDSTFTDSQGKYLFDSLLSGNYQVQFVLPLGAEFTKQNAGSDTLDSDVSKLGLSQVITIDATKPLSDTLRNNPNIDAGLKAILGSIGDYVFLDKDNSGTQTPGDLPVAGVKVYLLDSLGKKIDSTTTGADGKYLFSNLPLGTYSVQFVAPAGTTFVTPNTGTDPTIDSNAGTGGKTGPITLTVGTPNVTSVDAGLKVMVDVSCITTPPTSVSGANVPVCKGSPYPTLKATVIGTGTVDWYKKATGGTAIATGTLNYTPIGNVVASDTFYLAARSTLPATANCPTNVPRTRVIVVVQTCIDTIDLHLTKKVDVKSVKLGDVVTYTIKVWNESNKNATGVEVTDQLPAGVQYVSSVASRGSYISSTGVWTIGNIAAASAPANGDTVTLTIKVKVIGEGVTFNTAEISRADQKDKDSTPGNGKDGEDDIDRACITVPFKLCLGQGVQATLPSIYSGIIWKDATGAIVPSNGNSVTFTKAGTYTFTATSGACPAGGCCPVIVEEINCCPANICLPLTIQRKRK